MKIFVVLAVCVAFGNCMPKHSAGKGGDKDEGEDGKDFKVAHLDVDEYKYDMRGLVERVKEADQKVAAFGDLAFAAVEDPSDEAFEELGEEWDDMTEHMEGTFDGIAYKLLELSLRLYRGADGFDEINFCDNFTNFNAVFDGEDVHGYILEMLTTFLADLECFRTLFANIEHVETVLDEGEGMDEHTASELVYGFMHYLHLGRLNAIRFQQAVNDAVSVISEDDKKKKEVKKLLQLRSLLHKTGLIDRRRR